MLLAFGQYSRAEEPTHELARFVSGEHALQNLIRFPEVEGSFSLTLYCAGRALPDGKVIRNTCYARDRDSNAGVFESAVAAAIEKARLTPAKINGKTLSVDLYYRVVFEQREQVKLVRTYPNWGVDSDSFGQLYQAPQKQHWLDYPSGCTYESALVAMTIDESGSPSSEPVIRFAEGSMVPEICEFWLLRRYAQSRFIPGRHSGHPVSATLVDVIGDINFNYTKNGD